MDFDAGVVITGMGVAIPLGIALADVWDRSVRGVSAIGPFRRFTPDQGGCTASAEVPPFTLADRLRSPKNEKFMSHSTRNAVHAALSAVADSQLNLGDVDPFRIGVYTGSGQTGLDNSEFFGALEVAAESDAPGQFAALGGRPARMLDRYFSLRTLANAGVGLVSMELGANGPNNNYVHGDTASAVAIAAAMRDLQDGRSDVAVVGGYDSLLTAAEYLAYDRAGLLSHATPDCAYRPFDRQRNGIVLGEGAAFLVLERASDARRRGASIHGEILGVGIANDAGDRLDAKASAAVLESAIAQAGGADVIDFVIAHGIGTVDGDRREAALLAGVCGERMPVTALKSQTGYVGAATAATELVLAVQAGRAGVVPPIARHTSADEACRLDLVSGAARALRAATPTALCLSWSWFGQCAAMAVRAGRANGGDA